MNNSLINILEKNNLLYENKEVYSYGINVIKIYLIITIITLLVAITLDELMEVIIFSSTLMALRFCAGGIHFKKRCMCIVISISLFILVPELITKMNINLNNDFLVIMFICIGIIVGLAPIDNNKKRLDDNQKKVFRFRTLKLLTLLGLIIIYLYLINNKLVLMIALAIITESLSIVLGAIKDNNRMLSNIREFLKQLLTNKYIY